MAQEFELEHIVTDDRDIEDFRSCYKLSIECFGKQQIKLIGIKKQIKKYILKWYRLLQMYNEYKTKLAIKGLNQDEAKEFDNVIYLKNRYLEILSYHQDKKKQTEKTIQNLKKDVFHWKLLSEGCKLYAYHEKLYYCKVDKE